MERAKVGTAVFIVREGRLLLQRRAGAHGIGTWSVPGGHVEFGETPEQTVIRETMEEVGVTIDSATLVAVTNDVFPESGKHYVTLWLRASGIGNETPRTTPGETSDVAWFKPDSLPSPLFTSLADLIAGKSIIPFDFRSLFA